MFRAVLLILAASAALLLPAAEIPPFYPPVQPAAPRGTAIAPSEVAFTLASGTEVRLEKYTGKRSLNGMWKFSGVERSARPFPDGSRGFEAPGFDDSGWEEIAVPLNWYRKYRGVYDRREPYNRGFYRHSFELTPEELAERRVVLHFDFIGYEATLWINGRMAGTHHGDFTPWNADITDFVRPGRNSFTVCVTQDFGPALGNIARAVRTYGSQWSSDNIKGGIWGDVELRFEPPVRMTKLLVTPQLQQETVRLDLTLENTTGETVECTLSAAVTGAMKADPNRKAGESEEQLLRLAPGTTRLSATVKLDSPVLWSPESPHLYYASAALTRNGALLSARTERFGFREFTVKDGKFHLNGERLQLFGENLPSNSYGGRGWDSERESAQLHKVLAGFKARGYNIVRNAHMPIMHEALDIADEIGLMFYDEWSWSFTRTIEEKEFERRNDRELLEWLERDCNHPSVVMWSCGNEVRHADSPPTFRQLNRQVGLMRRNDPQRRPAGVFSGSADFMSYGEAPLTTDFLDLHNYLGIGTAPWTHWTKRMDEIHAKLLAIYKRPGGALGMPYIIWESVGFSWGGSTDRSFRTDDTAQYAQYVKKPTSWAQSNGVGFIGTLGLAAALDPARGTDYGKRLYGHRLLELMRQDLRFDGFAPWFHGSGLNAATLWNQRVYPGLRRYAHRQPPRSLFAGREFRGELFVVNSAARPVKEAQFHAYFTTDGRDRHGETVFRLPGAAPFTVYSREVLIPVPAELSGNCQIRIELRENGRLAGQNFYNVFIADTRKLAQPVPCREAVALLDAGSPEDVEHTARLLKRFGVKFERLPSGALPSGAFRFAVVPAGISNRGKLKLDRAKLFEWIGNEGGTLLVLEQNHAADPLIDNTLMVKGGQTFVDLVHPSHPVFEGLEPINFDTWENPEDSGHVITCAVSPFLNNALAVKGAMLGGRGVDNAVIEAKLGKGRLFWSQLAAVTQAERDGVAATYLRNLFDYLLNRPVYGKVTELAPEFRKAVSIDPARLEPVSLAPYANRSFSDEVNNDGEGGWTDQGTNDLRNMPLGRRTAGGVAFEIIDPAENGGKSCLVLRGSERPRFPSEVTGIAVNARYVRLYFLHTAAWSEGDVGVYRIRYEDGSTVDFRLRHGINIGDWWNTTFLSDAVPGIVCSNPTRERVGSYVAAWENPHPEKLIRNFDFLSISSPLLREINFNPSKTPVPVLIAVTGEKAAEKP
ncbi:MAG: glycoside hydrolase family 2 [Lentisphaeria bacterium]|nr:glycoside hydrolase family 2 [Lentisphaeria bacterium]